MSNNKLVSIITPCYNGESYIERYINTILSQTYSNIELIFINDGSNDSTEDIIINHKYSFEDRGIELTYIYQDNAGQAAAINKGLKIFKGDYLMWTDVDDILDPENVEKKVEFLESHDNYGFVICQGKIVDESNIDIPIGILCRHKPKKDENLFEDYILERNVIFMPGVYMVRRSAFLRAIPSRQIYESRVGQNWQMLLPLSYYYRCGYLEEDLFTYVIHKDSHSRKEKTEYEKIDKAVKHEQTIYTVLEEMRISNLVYYQQMVRTKYMKWKFYIANKYNDQTLVSDIYMQLKKEHKVRPYQFIVYHSKKHICIYVLMRFMQLTNIINN